MEEAQFRLVTYCFDKVEMDLNNISDNITLNISPSGNYNSKNGEFELEFKFNAYSNNQTDAFLMIVCKAIFEFKEVIPIDNFPQYFYSNSIAIVFPYVRAFISTVTLQANKIRPIILPTMNLISLQSELKAKTTVI